MWNATLFASVLLSLAIPPELSSFDFVVQAEFDGVAKGGNLQFVYDTYSMKYYSASVDTIPGQSGEAIAQALMESFKVSSGGGAFIKAVCEGASIYMPAFPCFLVGTETGFKTLSPPRFATISYLDDDSVAVCWVPYPIKDTQVMIGGAVGGVVPASNGKEVFRKVSQQLRHDPRRLNYPGPLELPDPRDMAFVVLTELRAEITRPNEFRMRTESQMQSRTTRIHVSGRRQEDLDNVPFYGDVMPNWVAWSPAGFEEGTLRLYQGEKAEVIEPARSMAFASSPDTKFTCQMFEIPKRTVTEAAATEAATVDGGVYRRYLGLIPGHKYRVFGRFNTFESDPAAGDWRLSFHSCADPPGQGLTVAQLSGKEPLPSGATLPDGACIASFGTKGQTTNGKWVQVSTGTRGASADIEIPEGSTSLSAWVRVTGKIPTRFGMDWSALEDVTPPAQPSPSASTPP